MNTENAMYKYHIYGNTISAIILAIVDFFWNEMNFIDRIRFVQELLHFPGLAFTKELVDCANAVRTRHNAKKPTIDLLLEMRKGYIEGSECWNAITQTVELMNVTPSKMWGQESPLCREFYTDRTLTRNHKRPD